MPVSISWDAAVKFLLKTDSGYPKDVGAGYPRKPLGIPSARSPFVQLTTFRPRPFQGSPTQVSSMLKFHTIGAVQKVQADDRAGGYGWGAGHQGVGPDLDSGGIRAIQKHGGLGGTQP